MNSEKFKKEAEEWAEKILKEEHLDFNDDKFIEFVTLGSLIFDNNGKWIPRLGKNTKFEIKPIKVIDSKIKL